jgi:hypothetical protein
MVNSSRQAGVSQFEGTYEFEVLRRIVGDAAAEEFLLVDYHLPERHSGAADVANGAVNIDHSDGVDTGAQFPPRGGTGFAGTAVLITPLAVNNSIPPLCRLP